MQLYHPGSQQKVLRTYSEEKRISLINTARETGHLRGEDGLVPVSYLCQSQHKMD